MPDLTAAEQAVLDVLYGAYGDQCDPHGDTRDEIEPVARAVVDAVRPILAAEVLREVAAELRLKAPEPGTLFFVDAEGLERRAEDRLAAARQSGEGQR